MSPPAAACSTTASMSSNTVSQSTSSPCVFSILSRYQRSRSTLIVATSRAGQSRRPRESLQNFLFGPAASLQTLLKFAAGIVPELVERGHTDAGPLGDLVRLHAVEQDVA